VFGVWSLLPATAATNAAEEIGVPKLSPPYSELPPTFWEHHRFKVLLLAVIVPLVTYGSCWLLRHRKPVPVLPPEVQAREALEALQSKSEDSVLLSQVSRILREYFRSAFDLPREELTMTEFCRVLSVHEGVGTELAATVSEFLRRCDERKFSTQSSAPLNAAMRALELLSAGETRRAKLRQQAGRVQASTSTQQ